MLDLLSFIPPGDHAAIFSGVGVYADDALDEAIAYGLSLGSIPAIEFPAGRLRFACTARLRNTVNLCGHGSGLAGHNPTVCQFDADLSGFVIDHSAEGTVLDGMRIEGAGTIGHGVWMRGRAAVRDVQVNGFGENGVNIVADVRSTDPERQGNANLFLLDTLRITNSGGHGIYLDGGDVNAGEGRHIDVTSNGGWGIYDSSFLGNTWVACHAADNEFGPYKTDDPNARSVFLGCYSEGGQPQAEFSGTTVVLGGLHGAGFTGGQWMRDGKLSPFRVYGASGARPVQYRLAQYDSAGLDIVADGDHSYGWSFGWWDEGSKTVQFRHARLNSRWTVALTTNLSEIPDQDGNNIGPGQMLLNNVWAHAGGGRYRRIDLADLLQRIEALEQA